MVNGLQGSDRARELVILALKDDEAYVSCINDLRLLIESGVGLNIIHELLSSENKRENTIGILLLEELPSRVVESNEEYLVKTAKRLSTDQDPWKRKVFIQFSMCLSEIDDNTIFTICAMLNDIHLDVRCWAIRFISKLPIAGRDLSRSFLAEKAAGSADFPYKDRAYRAMKIADLLADGRNTSYIFSNVSCEDSYTVDFFRWFEKCP